MHDKDSKSSPNRRAQTGQSTPAAERAIAPGKRTRTMGMATRGAGRPGPVQQMPDPTEQAARAQRAAVTAQWIATTTRPDLHPPPVQQRRASQEPPAREVHSLATQGLSGASAKLPYLDQIQRSFGRHDASGIEAHIGGPATPASRAMGASAYATGNHVAFREAPDLHTAAHEAAHVMQQRGGVALAGGVGREGDIYERHADEVAARVVRGQSAESLLDLHAPASAAPAQGVQMRRNSVDLHSQGWEQQPESVHAVQERLIELGVLERGAVAEPGVMDQATREAIAAFQEREGHDIEQVRDDSAHMRDTFGNAAGNSAAAAVEEGTFRANDATHQALVNAWPRTMFGVTLDGVEAGYQFIKSLVLRRGLPFDDTKVNIVGIRGFQGGEVHDNDGARWLTNRYDDTMFLLARGEDPSAHMVREFRGTTDPGGRSRGARRDREERQHRRLPQGQRAAAVEGALREQDARRVDPDTEAMAADQQLPYSFSMRPSRKFGRPMLGPRPDADGAPQVHDPHRDEAIAEHGALRYPDDGNQDPGGSRPEEDRYDRVRTIHGREHGGRPQHMARDHGIAIHSGGSSDQVFADSTGCQVVHGDWYGSFIASLRRAIYCMHRHDRGEDATLPDDGNLGEDADSGEVLYSLLDGAELQAGIERE